MRFVVCFSIMMMVCITNRATAQSTLPQQKESAFAMGGMLHATSVVPTEKDEPVGALFKLDTLFGHTRFPLRLQFELPLEFRKGEPVFPYAGILLDVGKKFNETTALAVGFGSTFRDRKTYDHAVRSWFRLDVDVSRRRMIYRTIVDVGPLPGGNAGVPYAAFQLLFKVLEQDSITIAAVLGVAVHEETEGTMDIGVEILFNRFDF